MKKLKAVFAVLCPWCAVLLVVMSAGAVADQGSNRVYQAIRKLPVCWEDRADPEKDRQLRVISAAIEDASGHAGWRGKRVELQALLAEVAYGESALCRRIHRNQCKKHECDGGRARGLWQGQRWGDTPEAIWSAMGRDDAESTGIAAREAARRLSAFYRSCGSISGALRAYGSGKGCAGTLRDESKRIGRYQQILRRL